MDFYPVFKRYAENYKLTDLYIEGDWHWSELAQSLIAKELIQWGALQ